MKKQHLPNMDHWTDKQISTFWETHSVAEFIDEMEEVGDIKFVPQKTAISVRVEVTDLDELKRLAKEKGVGHTTLVRVFIKDGLRRSRHEHQSTHSKSATS